MFSTYNCGSLFRNIAKLRRINDVIFTHENLRFEMSSTLGLKEAKLKFNEYGVSFFSLYI
jgi:hypothetical protein